MEIDVRRFTDDSQKWPELVAQLSSQNAVLECKSTPTKVLALVEALLVDNSYLYALPACVMLSNLEEFNTRGLRDAAAAALTAISREQVDVASDHVASTVCKLVATASPSMQVLAVVVKCWKYMPSRPLSNLHAAILSLMIRLKQYRLACRIVLQRNEFMSWKLHKNVFLSDLLSLSYSTGIILAARRKHMEACRWFYTTMKLPSTKSFVNEVSVAAYARFTLCALIGYGSVRVAEEEISCTSGRSFPLMEQYCEEYAEFAKAFENRNMTGLMKVIVDNEAGFHEHGTWGLVRRCVREFVAQDVRRMTSTHVAVPMSEVVKRTGLGVGETETCIVEQIEAGKMSARIDRATDTVLFRGNDAMVTQSLVKQKVEDHTDRVHSLVQSIREAAEQVSSRSNRLPYDSRSKKTMRIPFDY